MDAGPRGGEESWGDPSTAGNRGLARGRGLARRCGYLTGTEAAPLIDTSLSACRSASRTLSQFWRTRAPGERERGCELNA